MPTISISDLKNIEIPILPIEDLELASKRKLEKLSYAELLVIKEKYENLNMGAEKKKFKLMEDFYKFEANLSRSYDKLQYPYIKYKIGRKMMKIYPHTMEYFLMTYLIALKEKININVVKHYEKYNMSLEGSIDDCLNMNDFINYIYYIPSSILADYRKKRQYVNSILAKNEIDSNNYYNKKLFVRRNRGCYDLNPKLKIIYENDSN
jgi:hypothetical protein